MRAPAPPAGQAGVIARHGSLAFIDKPSGILVHNSEWAGPREHALVDDVRALLGDGWHPLHRLDRQTSGVVAFAEHTAVAAWQQALAADDCEKRYWALVRGHVSVSVHIDHPFADDDSDVVRAAVSDVTPLLLSSIDRCSLVEVRIFTGRRHQVRRHLKHIAHPVIGDATHGKGPLNRAFRAYGVTRMALHAKSITLTDPAARARLHAVSAVPEDLLLAMHALFAADDVDALSARA